VELPDADYKTTLHTIFEEEEEEEKKSLNMIKRNL